MAKQFLGDNFTIDLEQIPAYRVMTGTFHAQCDKQLIDMLAEHPGLHPCSRKMVADMAACVRDNRLAVRYAPRHGLGRRYAETCSEPRLPNGRKNPDYGVLCGSLLMLPRLAKNTLFLYHGWLDIDQVKGHPTLICELGLRAKHEMKAFQEYLAPGGFDRIVADTCKWHNAGQDPANHLSKKDVKLLYNRTIYGGSFAGWVKEITEGKKDSEDPSVWVVRPRKIRNPGNPEAFYSRFLTETREIMDLVYTNNPEIQKRVCKDLPLPEEGAKDYAKALHDRKGRVMSYVMGILEFDVTYTALMWLIKKGFIKDRVVDNGHDGLTFPCPSGDFCIDKCLAELNAHVRRTTGFKTVAFAHKTFDEWLDDALQARLKLPAEPEWEAAPEARDHFGACEVVLDALKERMVYSRGAIFMRVGESQYWVSDAGMISAHLLTYIAKFEFMQYNEKKGEMVPFRFGGMHKECVQIKKFVEAELRKREDDKFYDKFHSTTVGRVCFQDGVFDFREGRFYRWGALPWEYHSCMQIPMDGYPIFVDGAQDEEAIAELRAKLFEPLFGEKCDLALQAFARNIAGHWEDKVFSTYFGNRNCGKGVLQKMFESAFGPYIQAVDVANFVCVRATTKVEAARDKAWALPMEFSRLTFGQENSAVDVTQKYNGNLIKSLCSGTDVHKARNLYENTRSFKIQSSLILLGNDELDISPADTWEFGLRFNSTVQFKSQAWIDEQRAAGAPEILLESYRVADPTILTACTTDRWRAAMIHLLVRAYRPTAVVVPRDELASTDLSSSLRGQILAKFEVTRDPKHTVLNSDIDAWRVGAQLGVSAAKVYTELKALGCQPGVTRGRRFFRGLVARAAACDDQDTDTD